MANAKIILTFHNDLTLNQGIGFTIKIGSSFPIAMSLFGKIQELDLVKLQLELLL